VKAERDALATINDFYKENPWVVRLYYSFQDALYLYLVMEYIAGGDLMTQLFALDIFTEDETKFYIAELVLAIDSIHKMGLIHRYVIVIEILLTSLTH
jgi:serine/threonine protein kinase